MVQVIESLDQFNELTGGDQIVVVDYWATWCGPCKVISPVFAKMESMYPEIKFAKMDVDDVEDVAAKEDIRAMPTFVAYKNGKRVDNVVGAVPAKLKAMMDKLSGKE